MLRWTKSRASLTTSLYIINVCSNVILNILSSKSSSKMFSATAGLGNEHVLKDYCGTGSRQIKSKNITSLKWWALPMSRIWVLTWFLQGKQTPIISCSVVLRPIATYIMRSAKSWGLIEVLSFTLQVCLIHKTPPSIPKNQKRMDGVLWLSFFHPQHPLRFQKNKKRINGVLWLCKRGDLVDETYLNM